MDPRDVINKSITISGLKKRKKKHISLKEYAEGKNYPVKEPDITRKFDSKKWGNNPFAVIDDVDLATNLLEIKVVDKTGEETGYTINQALSFVENAGKWLKNKYPKLYNKEKRTFTSFLPGGKGWMQRKYKKDYGSYK